MNEELAQIARVSLNAQIAEAKTHVTIARTLAAFVRTMPTERKATLREQKKANAALEAAGINSPRVHFNGSGMHSQDFKVYYNREADRYSLEDVTFYLDRGDLRKDELQSCIFPFHEGAAKKLDSIADEKEAYILKCQNTLDGLAASLEAFEAAGQAVKAALVTFRAVCKEIPYVAMEKLVNAKNWSDIYRAC